MELNLTSVSKEVGSKAATSFPASRPAGTFLPSGATYLVFVVLQ